MDYRGGLLYQRLGFDGIRGLFVSLAGHFFIQSCDNKGNRFNHSVDRSPEGSLISWAYWCPKTRSASARLKLTTMLWSLWNPDVNRTAPNLDRVLRQQLTDGAHELAPRVNLKELRPPQGAPLVNPSKAIGDLCRSLASQGLSLFVAAGDVNAVRA